MEVEFPITLTVFRTTPDGIYGLDVYVNTGAERVHFQKGYLVLE